jgi:CheY-like chemotaxis protein
MTHQALMEQWGYKYDIASNGTEAVKLAKCNLGQYDLCIMDVSMPVMNGIDATHAIRNAVSYFPIMGYSADYEARYRCLAAGMDEFTLKPCQPEEMFEIIRDLTVKPVAVTANKQEISKQRIMPMNAEQLKELRELEKKGLAVLIVENGTQRFVVHKNIQNKMSHVLVGEGKELFEFLDRGEMPANCHLYRRNMQTNRLLLTPEQYEQRLQEEDTDIENYTNPVDQREEPES